jgi:hypothetical protein
MGDYSQIFREPWVNTMESPWVNITDVPKKRREDRETWLESLGFENPCTERQWSKSVFSKEFLFNADLEYEKSRKTGKQMRRSYLASLWGARTRARLAR